jgi:predicted Zn finger-like uncharacterized protein
MLIVCPSCASEYTIDSDRVGADGRTVRCASCRTAWFVRAEKPQEVTAPDPASLAAEDGLGFPSADPEAISVEASAGRSTADRRRKATARSPAAAIAVQASASKRRWPLGLVMAILCLGLSVATLAGRADIVRAFPQTAKLYAFMRLPVNLRGLDLKGVTSRISQAGTDTFLVVEGEIANATAREVALPNLELAVIGSEGQLLYTWTNDAPRPTLGVAEATRFRARLASPPAEGRQVFVRFARAGGGGAEPQSGQAAR